MDPTWCVSWKTGVDGTTKKPLGLWDASQQNSWISVTLPVTTLAGLPVRAGASPSEGLILSHFANTGESNSASLFFVPSPLPMLIEFDSLANRICQIW